MNRPKTQIKVTSISGANVMHISTHPPDTSSSFDLDVNRRKETDEESWTGNITRTEHMHHDTVLNNIA